MGEKTISVVINTFNEERNIKNVISSVKSWANEIIVVDMYSTDNTEALALSEGAIVFRHTNLGYADPARQFAIDKASGDWILVLDADEMVPQNLSRRLINIAGSDMFDAVNIPWLNYIWGAPILHSGWGPSQDKHVRFFRNGAVEFGAKVHDFTEIVRKTRIYDMPYERGFAIIHFNYVDVEQFINKLNRYTELEIKKHEHDSSKNILLSIFSSGGKIFLSRYFKYDGYKDGWRGLALAVLMSFYSVVVILKSVQNLRAGDKDHIYEEYARIAKGLINEYEKI